MGLWAKIFWPLVHSSNGHKTQNSVQIFCVGRRDPSSWTQICLSKCICWIRSRTTRTQTGTELQDAISPHCTTTWFTILLNTTYLPLWYNSLCRITHDHYYYAIYTIYSLFLSQERGYEAFATKEDLGSCVKHLTSLVYTHGVFAKELGWSLLISK